MISEFVCPALGFMEFLHMDWLKQILSWQSPSGCYGHMPRSKLGKHLPQGETISYEYQDKKIIEPRQAVDQGQNEPNIGLGQIRTEQNQGQELLNRPQGREGELRYGGPGKVEMRQPGMNMAVQQSVGTNNTLQLHEAPQGQPHIIRGDNQPRGQQVQNLNIFQGQQVDQHGPGQRVKNPDEFFQGQIQIDGKKMQRIRRRTDDNGNELPQNIANGLDRHGPQAQMGIPVNEERDLEHRLGNERYLDDTRGDDAEDDNQDENRDDTYADGRHNGEGVQGNPDDIVVGEKHDNQGQLGQDMINIPIVKDPHERRAHEEDDYADEHHDQLRRKVLAVDSEWNNQAVAGKARKLLMERSLSGITLSFL